MKIVTPKNIEYSAQAWKIYEYYCTAFIVSIILIFLAVIKTNYFVIALSIIVTIVLCLVAKSKRPDTREYEEFDTRKLKPNQEISLLTGKISEI